MLQSIDAGQLDLLIGVVAFRAGPSGLLVIALDGKVLRGAWTADNGQVTLFSAMIHGVGVTVAQIRVPDGTNEIIQLDALLAGVPVGTPERVIVTLDAAHTQRDTAEHLRAELGFISEHLDNASAQAGRQLTAVGLLALNAEPGPGLVPADPAVNRCTARVCVRHARLNHRRTAC